MFLRKRTKMAIFGFLNVKFVGVSGIGRAACVAEWMGPAMILGFVSRSTLLASQHNLLKNCSATGLIL
jgi:hypothetical protein